MIRLLMAMAAVAMIAPAACESGNSWRPVVGGDVEEHGLIGSERYVHARASLQGVEDPAGSGLYPEPTWLGVLQHDMILFDHGLPPGPHQIVGADLDVEYDGSSRLASDSAELATRLVTGAASWSAYPAQVGAEMCCTDSVPFQEHVASVSVRENRRRYEIGAGSNPHWHQRTDVAATYSDDDFALGFAAVEMTVGTVAELVAARVTPGLLT